ncbi:MAG TPA: hypothetical protein VEJ18_19670 [Planctomycetota bacterium]|nr:hypothetical protein [Planctomycetota bacterium]
MRVLGLAVAVACLQSDLPELLKEDFETGADRWEFTDAAAWKVDGGTLQQHAKSKYVPPHRSPFNIALLKDVVVGDFVLEARCRSTVKDYGHRDLCLIFGYQDPGRFYYSHLGKKTDDHANQIFIVNGASRAKISARTTDGIPWTDEWVRVKVVRKVEEGLIEVYWKDMTTPVQTARDATFRWGRIGLGSFDDTGAWDDVRLCGRRVDPPK